MAKRANPAFTGLFDRDGQEAFVARVLDRAVEKRIRDAKRATSLVNFSVTKFRREQRERLGSSLAAALISNGAVVRPRTSIRLRAPDTGGRSFHFKYYTVSKSAKATKSSGDAGAAGAHQRYIERPTAVEEINQREATPPSGVARDSKPFYIGVPGTTGYNASRAGTLSAALDNEPAEIGAAGAAQGYIENPTKLLNGEFGLQSWGTIGNTFEERVEFWKLVEGCEAKNGRVQSRFIIELPFQSTPEARREIMQRFLLPFDKAGLPYHVAIHAPGQHNDARNVHAHIVLSERPAKKMRHPATGQMVWDFTIVETYRKKSRNLATKRPFRQNRDRGLQARDFVREQRVRFAAIVTDVMASIDQAVVFDPRSYADMGLDVSPLKALDRFMHAQRGGRGQVIKFKMVTPTSEHRTCAGLTCS